MIDNKTVGHNSNRDRFTSNSCIASIDTDTLSSTGSPNFKALSISTRTVIDDTGNNSMSNLNLDECNGDESKIEIFFKYGIDSLVSLIMIKYLIGNLLIIIFKIIIVSIEYNIDHSNNNNNAVTWNDFEMWCIYGHAIGMWFVIFSTWTLFLFMALRALKIELNRYNATFCDQLSPILCVFGCILMFIYHTFVIFSIKYEISNDGLSCEMSNENNSKIMRLQSSQLVFTITLAVFMIWGLIAFIKPVWHQKEMLESINNSLTQTMNDINSNNNNNNNSNAYVININIGYNDNIANSTNQVIEQLKMTYRRVCIVGCLGYSLCLFGFWFLSHETDILLLSIYILIHILLFILMACTFDDMNKILCSFKYYNIFETCICIETKLKNSIDASKNESNIELSIKNDNNNTINASGNNNSNNNNSGHSATNDQTSLDMKKEKIMEKSNEKEQESIMGRLELSSLQESLANNVNNKHVKNGRSESKYGANNRLGLKPISLEFANNDSYQNNSNCIGKNRLKIVNVNTDTVPSETSTPIAVPIFNIVSHSHD